MPSGAERLEQVREALDYLYHRTPLEGEKCSDRGRSEMWDAALAALDGCVLLTAEEAEGIRMRLASVTGYEFGSLIALLTPEGSDDAEDDPYPENPGPFGTNPGEC